MADLRTIAALVAVSMAVSGCGLDILEGKESPYKKLSEQRAALTAIPETVVDQTPAAEPTPEPEPVVEPEPVPPPVMEPEPLQPECVPIFRVKECP